MNKEEISELLNLPFSELAEVCKDPEILAKVISIAINMGIRLGQAETRLAYNRIFLGYDKVSIEN